jgi:hypothetical protein
MLGYMLLQVLNLYRPKRRSHFTPLRGMQAICKLGNAIWASPCIEGRHRLPFSRTRQFLQQLYDEWCQPSPMEQPQQLPTTGREIGTTSVFRQAAAQPVVPNTHVLARLPDERKPRPVDGQRVS